MSVNAYAHARAYTYAHVCTLFWLMKIEKRSETRNLVSKINFLKKVSQPHL